jgi:outer membrane receptor protein involved in Fe transport
MLSPFQVSAADDDGYVAASSLAGSRMKTPLRDTAASISVMTEEFLADIGANDLTTALEWANNVQLDSIDTFAFGAAPNDNNTLTGPDSFRIRGVPASITRNYFSWIVPTDNFNVGRIEESRGPNSILFGIGSAGGIINFATKQALLTKNIRTVSAQVSSYGGYRGSFDINQTSFDNKLGVRVNAVRSHAGGYRQHVFKDTDRIHLALTYNIARKTQFRAEYEGGTFNEARARTVSIFDSVSGWEAAGSPTLTAPVAANNAFGRYGNANRVTFFGDTGTLLNMRAQNFSNGTSNAIEDPGVADQSINTGGPNQRQEGSYNATSLFLEQQIGKKTFLELAYNHQDSNQQSNFLSQGSSEGASLRADPNQLLPNGQPNPNVGGYFIEGAWARFDRVSKSDSIRLTASSEFDFGKWGNYRLAALGEHETRDYRNTNSREAWLNRPFNSTPENAVNLVTRRSYVTLGDWASYYVRGPGDLGLIENVMDPVTGQTLSSGFVTSGTPQDFPETQKTALLGGQARYFGGRLVLGFGYRYDELETTRYGTKRDPTTNIIGIDYDNVTELEYSGKTATFGVVGHLTNNISAFYNRSDNFSLPNSGARILPDSSFAPNPEGLGEDVGLMFTMLENKLSMRVAYYQIDMVNDVGGGFGGTVDNPTVLNNVILNTLVANQATTGFTQAMADAREISTNNATQDRHVQGYEFTLTANPTRNWRVQMNYSYSDGAQSNIAPEVKAWRAENIPFFQTFDQSLITGEATLRTIGAAIAAWESEFADITALEGIALPGNRKHKFNLFTRYTFRNGMLKGFYVGGGYRHQTKNVIGRDVNTGELLYGNSYGLADFLLGYRFSHARLQNLSLQLNVRNALDNTDPMITRRRDDGTVYRWRVQDPRSWQLTANFSF